MKKRLIYLLVCIMALGLSAYAVASAVSGADAPRVRASQPRKAQTSAPAARISAGDKQLYAFHCNAEDGALAGWRGLVKVNSGTPDKVKEMPGSAIFQAAYMGEKALVIHYAFGDYVTYEVYNTSEWSKVSSINYTRTSSNILPYSLSYDHTTDKVYGYFFADAWDWREGKMNQFGYIDLGNAGNPIVIVNANTTTVMRATTFDQDGNMIGLAFDGGLYSINKFTGESTPTGVSVNLHAGEDADVSSPFGTYGRESMCCDWETGDIYIAYGNDFGDTFVSKFNPTTGASTLLADYGFEGNYECNILTGLFFEQKVAAAKGTPDVVANLNAVAVGTELKANVSFNMPAVDTEGNALDTDLTWSIGDGTAQFATGTAHSGAKVETVVEFPAAGRTTIYVTAANGSAVSNMASASLFVGCDTPKILGLPVVRVNGQRVTVTWNEAVPCDEGNLDPVTYKITRQPDNVVVAEAHGTNSFVDVLESDIKTMYYYQIQPKSGNNVGETVDSRKAYAGTYFSMPLNEDFSDEARFLQYPIIDANNDFNVWEWTSQFGGRALYTSNNKAADDYLLIGPFKMEAGASYQFHMKVGSHSMREDVALYVGTDPDNVKSFNTQLIAPTRIVVADGDKDLDASFEPETSGDYYFGIHACTPQASKILYLYEVTVKAIGGDAPAAPANLELVPQAQSAIINFTLPSKSINGADLESLTSALVYRDDNLIATITNGVAPGAAISYTDNAQVGRGLHTYSVSSVNAAGEGKYISGQVWRGGDMPGKPSNLRLWEDVNTPGLIHASFDAPARGYNGGYVNPEEIDYVINWSVMGVASGDFELGKGTEHSFMLPFEITKQDIFAGSVYGRNAYGSVASTGNWITSTAYFGPAMTLPVHDSWSDDAKSGGYWSGQNIDDDAGLSESYWGTANYPSQDGDGGLNAYTTNVDGRGKRLMSPRVTIEGAVNPTLVFYYRYTAKTTMFNLEIMVDDQPFTVIKELDLAAANVGKWIRVEMPLEAYKDSKHLQFGFSARGAVGEEICGIDNVTISDLVANDLSIVDFTAPVKVNANALANFQVKVRNTGSNAVAAGDYSVKIYKNGELLTTVPGVALALDREAAIGASDVPSVADPESCVYYAEIDYAADQNASNNVSNNASVRIVIVDYPTVDDLQGESQDGIVLTWSDPDMSKIPGVSVTETFESYAAFIIDNIGPWTVHDGDGQLTTVMATSYGPLEYPHIGEPMAWQVFDPATANVWGNSWYARSGSKMLVSIQAATAETRQLQCDDWLISPELNGAEQVITFYSNTGSGGSLSPEIFDFMVSDKTDALADFTVLAGDVEVPYGGYDWQEFAFRVPAGTRYFAIVHKSVAKLAMMIDDITYIPAGSVPVQLDLLGFNVYRDGKRVNPEPIGDNTYRDTDIVKDASYTYSVTAVWDKGESRLSDPVTITSTSGIDPSVTYDLTISGHVGFIRISGGIGEQAEVYNMAGALVASVKAEGTVEVPVAKGVYVVRAGGAAAKVAVR